MGFDDLYVGQEYTREFSVTEEMGRAFAQISQDFNLLHLDEDYAKRTMFQGRIVHGMLVASFISGVLGNDFPGVGTVYLEQNLKFVRPVRYGDVISVIIQVMDKDVVTNRIKLSTICRNEAGKNVIEGMAEVMKKG